jgi:hypothetical protein
LRLMLVGAEQGASAFLIALYSLKMIK